MSNHRLQNFATHRQGVPFSNEPRRRQAAHGRTQSSQSQSMGATPSIGYNQEPGTALNTPLYGPNTSSGSVLSGTGQGVRTTPTQYDPIPFVNRNPLTKVQNAKPAIQRVRDECFSRGSRDGHPADR